MKIDWITLLGYGIVFWMFLYITDLFKAPSSTMRTSEEVEDLCEKPDRNQPQFSASQLSWTMFMVNSSSLLVIVIIILFIMVIITISRIAWNILSKVGEKMKIEFKTEDKEMLRLQNFSIKENSYLTRKLVEVLEEKTKLSKQITVLTNENRDIKTQNTYVFRQNEALTEELDIAKIECQSLLERSQATEAKFREFSRILDEHKEIENKILGLDLTLDTEVVKLTNSLSKLLDGGQQTLSSELEYSTESSEQLPEIDDKNDNCVLKSLDMPCEQNKKKPSTRCSDANLNAVTESEMDLLEKLKGVEERFGVSILNSKYLDHSTLQAIHSNTDQSQEKLEELEINAKGSTMDSSEQYGIPINSGSLTTIYEESDGSTYETLESAISISGNSNDAPNTTQSQVQINLKNSTSDEYEKSSHEILESKMKISKSSTDALNNKESKTKMDLRNSTTIISDEHDNASYATFESAVTNSGNIPNALNTNQTQSKITLTRNNSEWETQSSESSPETLCLYEKFVAVTRKYIIEPPKIQDTLSVTLPKHLGNMRNRLTTTDKFGPTTQLVQEPKGLVSSSIAFENFMKKLNEFDAP
ncbi:unnamed protein product [Ceutorhynchus assimilis]|uniref:Uncharacterized protein n=1 Tax=Ceutorhynchus assimilis TaxID=467358 RepID=A0A9N9QE25_9CUCU|nr:unnamed protein product [Ceutorhynchus assimilis]